MKILKKMAFIAISTVALISCNNDDALSTSEKKVDAYIQFESVFGDKEFDLNTDYTSTNNGTLNISTLKYIITDIKLFGTEGTSNFEVSTQESFHIVDQSCQASLNKYLTNIPNGKYNKVSFRYGVSDKIQNAGTDAQGDMLVAADAAGLSWGWTLGYRFMTYEGFSSKKEEHFKVHNGSTGAIKTETTHASKINNDAPGGHGHTSGARVDNSQIIEIDFSSDGVILVSDNTSPKIHLKVDIAKILSSTHSLNVAEGDIIVDAHKSAKVAENVATAFTFEHIHPTDVNFELPEIKNCNGTSNPNEGDGHAHNDKKKHEHTDDKKQDETSKKEVSEGHTHS